MRGEKNSWELLQTHKNGRKLGLEPAQPLLPLTWGLLGASPWRVMNFGVETGLGLDFIKKTFRVFGTQTLHMSLINVEHFLRQTGHSNKDRVIT